MLAFSISTFFIGAITLFIAIAPLYVGGDAIGMFIKRFRHQDAKSYLESVKSKKNLILCIVLVALIPLWFLYSTFTSLAPEGFYEIEVSYSIFGGFEDEDGKWIEFSDEGVAPLTIYFSHEEYEYEAGSDHITGEKRTSTKYNYVFYAESILISKMSPEPLSLGDSEIYSTKYTNDEVFCNGHYYDIELDIGELSDNRLGYSWEKKFMSVSVGNKIFFSVEFALSVLGLVGYFYASSSRRKEDQTLSEPKENKN